MNLATYKDTILPIKNKLYRMALRITVNAAEAEDVVQEVLIKVWEDRTKLANVNNLQAWCMQMTKNKAIDKKRLKANQTESIDGLYSMQSHDLMPDKRAELGDTMSKIAQLMKQLPEKQRMSMQLRDIEGLSYQEISEALDIPVNQVKTNIFRARKGIKSKLMQLWTTN
jgi:RNA polymerase sigma factor (sigma-70 family)